MVLFFGVFLLDFCKQKLLYYLAFIKINLSLVSQNFNSHSIKVSKNPLKSVKVLVLLGLVIAWFTFGLRPFRLFFENALGFRLCCSLRLRRSLGEGEASGFIWLRCLNDPHIKNPRPGLSLSGKGMKEILLLNFVEA